MGNPFKDLSMSDGIAIASIAGLFLMGYSGIKSDVRHVQVEQVDHEARLRACEATDQILKEYYVANGKDIEHIKSGMSRIEQLILKELTQWEADYGNRGRQESSKEEKEKALEEKGFLCWDEWNAQGNG